MPHQPPSPRRFRLLRWSLFSLALVGLGFLLNAWLPPRARCTIQPEFAMICLSPDGATLVAGQITPFATGGATFPQQIRWISGEGSVQVWDTRSGRLTGTYLRGKNIRYGFFSPSCRYSLALQEWESDFDPTDEDPAKRTPKRIGEPGIYYLLDFHAQTERQIICKDQDSAAIEENLYSFDATQFSPKETFLFLHRAPGLLIEIATGKILQRFHGITRFHGFAPDESLLVLEKKNGPDVDVELWNPRSRQVVRKLTKTKGAALAPSGRTLAANVPEGLIVMDLATFQTRLLCPARKKWGREENPFSPDGKTLVTYGDEIMEIWDVAAGKRRGDPYRLAKRSYVSGCSFSPDSSCFSLVEGHDLSEKVGFGGVTHSLAFRRWPDIGDGNLRKRPGVGRAAAATAAARHRHPARPGAIPGPFFPLAT